MVSGPPREFKKMCSLFSVGVGDILRVRSTGLVVVCPKDAGVVGGDAEATSSNWAGSEMGSCGPVSEGLWTTVVSP